MYVYVHVNCVCFINAQRRAFYNFRNILIKQSVYYHVCSCGIQTNTNTLHNLNLFCAKQPLFKHWPACVVTWWWWWRWRLVLVLVSSTFTLNDAASHVFPVDILSTTNRKQRPSELTHIVQFKVQKYPFSHLVMRITRICMLKTFA